MQVGGAVRDAKGNLKFNKNTKRGREVEKEYEDTYSGGVLEKEEVIKKKKREVTKLGEEFRSKVSFASYPSPVSQSFRLWRNAHSLSGMKLMIARKRRYQEKQRSRSIFLRSDRSSCQGKERATKSNEYDQQEKGV
jgi:hypothetical protein